MKLIKGLFAICHAERTRNGFCHIVHIMRGDVGNSYEIGCAKVNYLNRTWEAYRFQSAIHSAVEKIECDEIYNFSERTKKRILRKI